MNVQIQSRHLLWDMGHANLQICHLIIVSRDQSIIFQKNIVVVSVLVLLSVSAFSLLTIKLS